METLGDFPTLLSRKRIGMRPNGAKVMYLIASMQDLTIVQSAYDNHPIALDRIRAMYDTSDQEIKSEVQKMAA
jgi:hypothetical protein